MSKSKTDPVYDQILKVLKANHFTSSVAILAGGGSERIVGIQVDSPPILMNDRVTRILEVLADFQVNVSPMRNEQYILVELKK